MAYRQSPTNVSMSGAKSTLVVFTGEIGGFPYPDDAFDRYPYYEIHEHLTLDPTCCLCECHCVLGPGEA